VVATMITITVTFKVMAAMISDGGGGGETEGSL